MNLAGNTAFLTLITFNYKITINQSVQMLEAVYNYAITNQKGRDIPLLYKKNIRYCRSHMKQEFTIWN